MKNHIWSNRLRFLALCFVLIGVSLAAPLGRARHVNASVTLISFTAEAQGDNSILIKWETGTEANTAGFNLHRALSAAELGTTEPASPALVFIPNKGDATFGDAYSHPDTAVSTGVLYYYRLYEVTRSGGAGDASWVVSAGIGVPTLTPTATATATATTVQVSATRTPTATGAPGTSSGGQPTATRQFTLTPQPTAAGGAGVTPAPGAATVAPTTAATIGTGVVSTPTGQPQPPAAATAAIASNITPLPPAATAPPAPPTPSPSPAVVAMSTVQPADEATPTATPPPQVFAAATSQPPLGTPDRTRADPTPVPADQASRNTGSIFLFGGGAILLAAAIGGGVLLYLRSRKS